MINAIERLTSKESIACRVKARRRELISAVALAGLFALSACKNDRDPNTLIQPKNHLLGVDRSAEGGNDSLTDGVNAYLWRGALDTLSFMPFASADALGGVILTDWYAPPVSPNERFKISVYILDQRLKSDALNVAIFRQEKQGGVWVDTPVAPHVVSDITSQILARARQLRVKHDQK